MSAPVVLDKQQPHTVRTRLCHQDSIRERAIAVVCKHREGCFDGGRCGAKRAGQDGGVDVQAGRAVAVGLGRVQLPADVRLRAGQRLLAGLEVRGACRDGRSGGGVGGQGGGGVVD